MKMGLLFISVLVIYISCVDGQSACTTPTGARGQCVSIYQCDPLITLLNKKDRTNEDVDTLKKSQCGFQSGVPQVCCPSQCFTIEGQLGTCIGVQTCPNIAALLAPPVSAEIMSYIQNSRCEGPDQYSVCCGQSVNLKSAKPTKVCVVSAAPPDSRTECCGVDGSAGNRIYGGNVTNVDQYPWLSIIEYRKNNRIKLLCGGALISGKYVLTAGHCVVGPVLRSGTPANVRLGEFDISHDGPDCLIVDGGGFDCTEGTVIIPIERSIPHPEYNPDSSLRRNDIALLRLTQLAPYTDFIRPICLPTSDLTLNPSPNLYLYAAGWGAVNETTSSSSVKLHVALPFHTLESCQPAYSVSKRNIQLWAGQICAGGVGGQDSCKGDSGGPLMYQRNNRTWEVIGIVSFGPTPCGIENIPGVYTNVFPYMPWIRGQIRP